MHASISYTNTILFRHPYLFVPIDRYTYYTPVPYSPRRVILPIFYIVSGVFLTSYELFSRQFVLFKNTLNHITLSSPTLTIYVYFISYKMSRMISANTI